MEIPGDREGARRAFRDLFLEDRRRGVVRDLPDYKQRFPGFWDVVAEEHAALLRGEPGGGGGAPATLAGTEGGPPGDGAAGERVGPYRILREIGRGGMGVVYEARDSRLPRRVALKVLSPQFASSSHLRLRFEREAALAARLDHPHVCTVYEAGTADGTPFLAMRFVEGRTLQEWIAEGKGGPAALPEAAVPGTAHGTTQGSPAPGTGATPAPAAPGAPSTTAVRARDDVTRVLRLFEAAALAVHAAHEAGLVHRDIKPGNIMITAAGEPVLLDFGLAREEADDSRLTQTGVLMGTPAYMSPEQLTARHIRLDRRTDVYSLGVTLYETLTGRLPFEAPTREQLYQRILVSDPADVRALNPAVPPDLRVVLETAMEKDPDRRYGTAAALAEDLRRVRRREPIRARPAGPWTRLQRWAQRNPATAAASASLFVALAGGMAVSLHLLGEARRERDSKEAALAEAERERGNAVAARDATARALTRARALGLASASAQAQEEDPMVALHLAVEAADREILPEVTERLHGAVAGSLERAVLDHGSPVDALAWSPAGDRVATGARDGKARVFDAAGRILAVIEGHGGPVREVAFSPSGDRLLTASEDGTARLWNSEGRAVAVLRGHGGPLTAALGLADGRWLTASEDGTARLWSAGGDEGPVLAGHEGAVTRIAAAPGGAVLATGGKDGTVRLWSGEGAPLRTVAVDDRVLALAFAPAGDRFLVSCTPFRRKHDGFPYRVRVFDAGGEVLASLEGHVNAIVDAAWSPDGSRIATNCAEGSVGLWKADGTLLESLPEPVPQARGNLAFSPDGLLLLNCGGDNAVRVRDGDGKVVSVLRGHRDRPVRARFSPDGESVATASGDGTARIWRVFSGEIAAFRPFGPGSQVRAAISKAEDRIALLSWERPEVRLLDGEGRPVAILRGHEAPPRFAGFHPPGERLTTLSSADGTLRSWSALTGEPLGAPLVFREPLAFLHSADGGRMLVLEEGAAGRVCDADGRVLWSLPPHAHGRVSGADFSPVGDLLATGDAAGNLFLWGPDGSLRASAKQGGSIMHLRFSPDGTRIAACGADGVVRLYDPAATLLAEMKGHTFIVGRAAWSADGSLLATSGRDMTARIWTAGGGPVAVLRGHRGEVQGVQFLPGGGRVVTAARGDSIRVWDLEGRVLDEIRLPGPSIVTGTPFPSGRRVLSGHEDGVFRISTLDPGELLRIARSRLTRPLGPEERIRYAGLLGEGDGAGPPR